MLCRGDFTQRRKGARKKTRRVEEKKIVEKKMSHAEDGSENGL
jgi:hypothetical protein